MGEVRRKDRITIMFCSTREKNGSEKVLGRLGLIIVQVWVTIQVDLIEHGGMASDTKSD